MESAPSSSLSRSRFSTPRILSLWYPGGRSLRAPFCGRQRRAGTQRAEELRCNSKVLLDRHRACQAKVGMCVDNEGEFVGMFVEPGEGYAHDAYLNFIIIIIMVS